MKKKFLKLLNFAEEFLIKNSQNEIIKQRLKYLKNVIINLL